jgi:putative addiction module killer protein
LIATAILIQARRALAASSFQLEIGSRVRYDTSIQGGDLSQIEIREYVTGQGRNLYRHWLAGLDGSVRQRVQARVRRMGGGNFGKDRHLGGSLHEAIMDFGPGYRLYYGYHLGKLVLLVSGGDKSTQEKDI